MILILVCCKNLQLSSFFVAIMTQISPRMFPHSLLGKISDGTPSPLIILPETYRCLTAVAVGTFPGKMWWRLKLGDIGKFLQGGGVCLTHQASVSIRFIRWGFFWRFARLNCELFRWCSFLTAWDRTMAFFEKTSSNHQHLGEGLKGTFFPFALTRVPPEDVLSWQSKDFLRPPNMKPMDRKKLTPPKTIKN